MQLSLAIDDPAAAAVFYQQATALPGSNGVAWQGLGSAADRMERQALRNGSGTSCWRPEQPGRSDAEKAIDHGLALAGSGADILDIGGESTRPGAAEVSIDAELDVERRWKDLHSGGRVGPRRVRIASELAVKLRAALEAAEKAAAAAGVKGNIRLVTHLDVDRPDIDRFVETVKEFFAIAA